MTISVTATIIPGQGNAARNHRLLIPRIAARFPEVANCSQYGTINVQLDQSLDRSCADFWTPHIAWIPAYMPGAERAHRLDQAVAIDHAPARLTDPRHRQPVLAPKQCVRLQRGGRDGRAVTDERRLDVPAERISVLWPRRVNETLRADDQFSNIR